ncbi:MAG: TM2 domain-containing protein [Bacteroidaceae bacterium]|nr:TM2 domain-containing protein [Bacteroidaceae bacterium]
MNGLNNGANENGRLLIEPGIAEILPAMLKVTLAKMPENKQAMFVEEYNRKKKSVGLAYFFLIVCFGMPYGYLGKWGLQLVYWFTGAGFFIWFFYLLFTLPNLVRNYNCDVAAQVVRDLVIMG